MNCAYCVVIQWSDEDKVFIASLPDFGPFAKTHGRTYEESAKNAREVLESLIEDYQESGRQLPKPTKFGSTVTV